MAGYLIAETTREEREKIVAESLGNIEASCGRDVSGLHRWRKRTPPDQHGI